MENVSNYRRMSFEELRHQRACQLKSDPCTDGKLFDNDWEVFVAKYDRKTGKYVSGTYCCDDAVS